jgi:hypothetical protein
MDDFFLPGTKRRAGSSLCVQSGKELAQEEQGGRQSTSSQFEGRPIWKCYWKAPLPPKVLIFGWKVINNGLASQVNKRTRNIVTYSTCEICGKEDESTTLALINCNHATALRDAMRQFWPLGFA